MKVALMNDDAQDPVSSLCDLNMALEGKTCKGYTSGPDPPTSFQTNQQNQLWVSTENPTNKQFGFK